MEAQEVYPDAGRHSILVSEHDWEVDGSMCPMAFAFAIDLGRVGNHGRCIRVDVEDISRLCHSMPEKQVGRHVSEVE